MKIYTEEELRKHLYNHDESFFEKLTPIKLLSDEEIETRSAQKAMIENPLIQGICQYYFNLGAVYVQDKIQGGNNEQ